MSEQASKNNQQIIIYGLIAVAVLLAAIVGILIWQQTQNTASPIPSNAFSQGGATGPSANAQNAPGMGGQQAPQGMGGQQAPPGMGGGMPGGAPGGQAAPAEVDPATATKVPAGMAPEAFAKAYYEACDKGDWKSAFSLLPADKQAGSSPDALKEQVSGYGVTGFKVTSATTQGDTAIVKVDQETGQYGTFENTWTFVKKDGQWFVASKAVSGMK